MGSGKAVGKEPGVVMKTMEDRGEGVVVAADSSSHNGSVSSAGRGSTGKATTTGYAGAECSFLPTPRQPQHLSSSSQSLLIGAIHNYTADSLTTISSEQHALDLEHNLAKVVPALAPQGQARNLERVGLKSVLPRKGPTAVRVAQELVISALR
ncbi:hypothetical protein Tco_0307712 [Tanacetum coccineum]